MRRKLILAVLILLAFVLQGTVFQTLSIASIVPNLLLILTVSFGFMRGKKEGMFVGFFCGLLIDIFYGSMIGFYALIYMYIGFCNGFLYKIFFDEDVKVPMVLVAGSDIAYGADCSLCSVAGWIFSAICSILFFRRWYIQYCLRQFYTDRSID